MEKKGVAVVFMLFLLVMAGISLWKISTAPQDSSELGAAFAYGSKIGVIEINGVISGDSDFSIVNTGMATSGSIMEALRTASQRQDIKAVVLRINSPGGTSTSAQEIGIEISKLHDTGKPIITSMGDICASGGYWLASGSDYIMANGTTLTGSIGVIMEFSNLEELFNKLGIKPEVIKSGAFKDMGSSSRPITEQERIMFDAMIADTYQQFLDHVAVGRQGKIEMEQLKAIADGRVLTGRQAQQNGLVDGIGNYYDALNKARELANLPENTPVEVINANGFWKNFNFRAQGLFDQVFNTQNLLNIKY